MEEKVVPIKLDTTNTTQMFKSLDLDANLENLDVDSLDLSELDLDPEDLAEIEAIDAELSENTTKAGNQTEKSSVDTVEPEKVEEEKPTE